MLESPGPRHRLLGEEQKGLPVHLRDYLRILQRNWLIIAMITLVSVGTAAAYSIAQSPLYEASTKVFVSTQSSGTVSELQQGNSFTQQAVKSYADLVTTPIVLDPVIEQYGLDQTAAEFAENVTATAPLDTVIIEVTVKDRSGADAATLANAVAESFSTAVAGLVPESADGTAQVQISTVQSATTPLRPSSPNVPLNLVGGLFAGLLVGLGTTILRQALDNRVRSLRDVELLTTTPILGGISYDPKAAARPLVVRDEPRSPRAEAYRSLRTNLQFLDFGGDAHSLVITSSVASEGKSSTSSNLAIAMADAGAKVAIIDADLRRPRLAEYLGLEGAVGLTDVLIGRADLSDVLQRWGGRNMYVLPAGSVPPNPSELLGSTAMTALIRRLEQEFDTVVIDAPPLLPVTDAAILARSTRGAIVVASAGKVHKNQLKTAITALESVGAHILGIVVTMLPVRGADAYGYGHYGYTYGDDVPAERSRDVSTSHTV